MPAESSKNPSQIAGEILSRRKQELEAWLHPAQREWIQDFSVDYPTLSWRRRFWFVAVRGKVALLFIGIVVGVVFLLLEFAESDQDRASGIPAPLVLATGGIACAIIVLVQLTFVRARSATARVESQRLAFEIAELETDSGPAHDAVVAPRLDKLLERLDAKESLLEQQRLRDTFFAFATASPLIGLAVTLSVPGATVKGPIGATLFELLVVVAYLFSRTRNRQLEQSIMQIEYELSLLTTRPDPAQRAERLYLKQQFELKRYYDEALRQSATLSFLGGFCIFGGFVVVGVTLAVLLSGEGAGRGSLILIVGALGGVLANFVAVVFLGMHSRTVRAMADFHNRLVGTNHLHLANTLLSKLAYVPADAAGPLRPGPELSEALPKVALEIVRTAMPQGPPDATKPENCLSARSTPR